MRFSLFICVIAGMAVVHSAWARNPAPLSLLGARAKWLSRTELLYQPRASFHLPSLRVEAVQVETGERWPFTVLRQEGADWRLRFDPAVALADWVREPTVFVVSDLHGREVDRTYFQTGALLDSLYHFTGCLGVCVESGRPLLRVWAPTARSVKVLWRDGARGSESASAPLVRGEQGTMELAGDSSWWNRAYLFEVEVFSLFTGRVETYQVTDPYSVGLILGSAASVVLDLHDPRWLPPGWNHASRPPLASRNDSVVYELHVRDFSSGDGSVPSELRGTYRALALQGTQGDRELRALAEAGITHVHLLPVYDFASVEEDRANRREPQLLLPPRSLTVWGEQP